MVEQQDKTFFAPRSLTELAHLRAVYPQATLLAGCTDISLWVNKQLRTLSWDIFRSLKCNHGNTVSVVFIPVGKWL
ncbi:MAG: hypothetical protein R3F53_25870 [Gammaproteobacteria bacterium]